MKHSFLAPSRYLVSLMLGIPLAILGFKVAALWGLLAGLVVGAVLTSRMLMRDAELLEPVVPKERCAPVTASEDEQAYALDANRAATLKRRFDQAAAEAHSLVTKTPVLH